MNSKFPYQQLGVRPSEITSETAYQSRREFSKRLGLAAGAAFWVGTGVPVAGHADPDGEGQSNKGNTKDLSFSHNNKLSPLAEEDKLTPFSDVTSYNNFYEFGLDKTDPKRYAGELMTDPWSVEVGGLTHREGVYNLEDILKQFALEERIYRLRCVEAWSMVIPWVGFPLAHLIRWLEPKTSAKYVAFETLERPSEMRGQRSRFSTLHWPYREGLRIDEALNPLSFMAVGLYGKALPNQNGAPVRLVVPWKYGFKSIKSIVKIRFTDRQPYTSWNASAPKEYGFYSNVNPEVDHPRWSQANERRLPSSLFKPNRIKTQMFNGYSEHVAHLYKNMDLARYF